MDDLAEKLGISRTPVRDALRRLEREGIIEHTGRKGFVTAAVDPDYRMHIYESRMAVEGFAARLAAKQSLSAQTHVAAAIDEASNLQLDSAKGSFEANRLVHRAVVEAARNPILLEAFDNLWDRGRSHQLYVNCFLAEDSQKLFREKHLPISDAIGTGDAELAQAAMMQHLHDGMEESLTTTH
jgi:DNA-binding GntR family transcriptional regulator